MVPLLLFVGEQRALASKERGIVAFPRGKPTPIQFDDAVGWNLQNRLCVASQVVDAARARRESRGVHYRSDFVELDDAGFGTPRRHPGLGVSA